MSKKAAFLLGVLTGALTSLAVQLIAALKDDSLSCFQKSFMDFVQSHDGIASLDAYLAEHPDTDKELAVAEIRNLGARGILDLKGMYLTGLAEATCRGRCVMARFNVPDANQAQPGEKEVFADG